jgi:hypothetical protein
MALLREQRLRPFVLDIETDSTIQPDEDAQKQRATEFVKAVGGFLNQAAGLAQVLPQAAPLLADTLKFVASQFRAGRELETSIDEFADQMKEMGKQPKPPSPEQIKAQTEAQSAQATNAKMMADAQATQADAEQKKQDLDHKAAVNAIEIQAKQTEADTKIRMMEADGQRAAEKHAQDMEKGALDIALLHTKIEQAGAMIDNQQRATDAKIEQTKTQTENSVASTNAGIEAQRAGTAIKAEQAKQKEPA